MFDESANISAKTWTRAMDPINKDGYSDGILEGKNNSFQSSFDIGYSQGISFGLKLGYRSAMNTNKPEDKQLNDPRAINCHICTSNNVNSTNIVNLFNMQKERNDSFLKDNK